MAKIGFLTSGGDGPGLNAAIYGGIIKAQDYGVEVIGIRGGYKGILEKQTMQLKPDAFKKWTWFSGTKLGAERLNVFDVQGTDMSEETLKNLKELGIDYLIVIGGNGSLSQAYELFSKKDLKVVGVPKTIDKDVLGTDYTLGFDSAVNGNTETIGEILNTAGSHGAIHIVDVMGRDAGHLALHSGNAANADMILIPEYRFSLYKVVELLKEKTKGGTKPSIIVYSEHAKPREDNELEYYCDPRLLKRLSISDFFATKLEELLKGYPIRHTVPGHTQRGAKPSPFDIEIGKKFGAAAVELAMNKQFGQMVSLKNGRITSTSLEGVTKGLNLVNTEKEYDKERLNAAIGGIGSGIY